MNKSKKLLVFALQMISAAVLVLADQWFKALAVEHLMGKDDIVLIKNFLSLSYAENTGAAFSVLSDSTMLLSVLTLLLLAGGVAFLLSGSQAVRCVLHWFDHNILCDLCMVCIFLDQ